MTETQDLAANGVRDDDGREAWPLRPALLAGIGAFAGLLVHLILGDSEGAGITAIQAGLAAAVMFGAAAVGFTLERRWSRASLGFAAAIALAALLVVLGNGAPQAWSGGEGWRVASLIVAIAIATILFQAMRDAGAPRVSYPAVYEHGWTDVVLAGASMAFVGLTFLLMLLLSALFQLVRIEFLHDLLESHWFPRVLAGFAFGAALGVLREQEQVVRTIQRLAAAVLAVLAPVLAVGLAIFLLALPFTGLGALWDATRSATPVLLFCIGGALVLANIVIADQPAHERRTPALRFAAMLLGLTLLPLAVIAAIATGLRIGQYGLTPERLWAAVFVGAACLCGLVYLAALAIGRMDWAAKVRPANLGLMMAVGAAAMLLATPLIDFNRISANDQVARLQSGKVTPDKFDWRALAFDFGRPGRAALDRLKGSADPAVRAGALAAAKAGGRWDLPSPVEERAQFSKHVLVVPANAVMSAELKAAIEQSRNLCRDDDLCRVLLQPDGQSAIVVSDSCSMLPPEQRADPMRCSVDVQAFVRDQTGWRRAGGGVAQTQPMTLDQQRESMRKERAAIESGDVTIRTVQRRQVFVGDKPQGELFE